MEKKELTDKLNLSGGGLTKSYEESIIVHSKNYSYGHSYKNQVFMTEEGDVSWSGTLEKSDEEAKKRYEELENDPHYKKATILKVYPTDSNYSFIEVIETSVLREHLLQEAKEKREMMSRLAFIAERLGYMEDPNKLIL